MAESVLHLRLWEVFSTPSKLYPNKQLFPQRREVPLHVPSPDHSGIADAVADGAMAWESAMLLGPHTAATAAEGAPEADGGRRKFRRWLPG